jgi:three-Cys-motif partner protein
MSALPPPEDDGLLIPEVGEWSQHKHYFLLRYIDAFTSSQKAKNWKGLHYVDLFAGAGIERIKATGHLGWGSPLIAAQAPKAFTKLHLCEKSVRKHHALKTRVEKLRPDSQILQGDANTKVTEITADVPQGALSLVFLDAYGLHLHYNTLKTLAALRADLIVFFPDYLDALRNWATYYLRNQMSNLDLCLGRDTNWRAVLSDVSSSKRPEALRALYIDQIKKLGFAHFDLQRISLPGGQPLYTLIFCSRSQFAARLWRSIAAKKPDGQRTFDFGE